MNACRTVALGAALLTVTPAWAGLDCLLRMDCRLPGALKPEGAKPATGRSQASVRSFDEAPQWAGSRRRTWRHRAVARTREPEAVSVAADAAEAERLKAIPAAIPEARIKVVASSEEREGAALAVEASVLSHSGRRLFAEDIHVVAAKGIGSVRDLKGKVVSFGPDGSAGQAAARRAFDAMGIKVEETPLDVDNALDGVSTGDLAAVVLLAPPPYARLTDMGRSGERLLPLPASVAPPMGMARAVIPSDAYPDMDGGKDVPTFSIDARLVEGARPTAAGAALLAQVAKHSDELSRKGLDLLKAEGPPPATRLGSR